jgi:type VII secretion-associated serine protease mycosin
VIAGRARSGRLRRWFVIGAAVVATAPIGVPAAAVLPGRAAEDGQWWLTQWRMDEVWQITDGAGVVVAVLDSGVDASVPELAGAVLAGADFIGRGTDGRTDVDDPGHGTAMAALVAARGGAGGYQGVAPGASILPVTTSIGGDEGPGEESMSRWITDGIRYAVDNGAQVISVSLGGTANPSRSPDGCPAAVAEAVRYAAERDVIVVASSGNIREGRPEFPGACPGVLTVGATDTQLEPWRDSHAGDHVEVTGPGTDMLLVTAGGGRGAGSGTSSSTALVAGAVALVRSQFPDAPAAEVLARIIHTARDLDAPGRDDVTGYGIVRPFQALTEPVPPDAPNPVWEDLAAAPDPGAGEAGATAAPPDVGMPPPSGSGDGGPRIGLLLVLGVGFLVLVVIGVVTAVVVSRSRRPG